MLIMFRMNYMRRLKTLGLSVTGQKKITLFIVEGVLGNNKGRSVASRTGCGNGYYR